MPISWQPNLTGIEDVWASYAPGIQERALQMATSSLITLTLGRVGTGVVTVRPPSPHRSAQCAPFSAPIDPNRIPLSGPVGFVDTIVADGVELDLTSGDWRLDNGHVLVWQGVGDTPIPDTQDLNKPLTDVGTWGVTYSQSYPVDEKGQIAVAHLAVEFAKALIPKGRCSLPRGVTNVVRSGVSFVVEAGMFPGGLTGIDVVDEFILSWTPSNGAVSRAVVLDPSTFNTQARTVSTAKMPTSSPWGA